MNKFKVLAIIPARGGSKGVKGKNIKLLNGKPLIAYTIDVTKESKIFDKIIVSTDSVEIAEISKEYGAEIPFMRPNELATDNASTMDVIIYCLNWFNDKNEHFDYIILLQPTTPLRISEDIINAFELFLEKNANAVVSVCETEHSPLWENTLSNDLSMTNFLRFEVKGKRRQDLPKYYRLNGAIYIAKIDYILKYCDWFKEKCFAYIMPKERSVDIDTEMDFKIAELFLE